MEYKTNKVRGILKRNGYIKEDRDPYCTWLNFGKESFKLYLIPELIQEVHKIDELYFKYTPPFVEYPVAEETYHTSNIEGANLSTLYETLSILQDRKVSNKKEGMVIGTSKAIEVLNMCKSIPLGVQIANELQRTIVQYYNENGREGYRDNSIYVVSDTEIIHRPCDSELITLLYPEVFKERSLHPIINAAIMHFLLVYLHPYYDGNGRTARILFKEYLIRKGYSKFYNIPISKYVHQKYNTYMRSISNSEIDRDITHSVIFFINIIEEILMEE
jgi:Fic family protein